MDGLSFNMQKEPVVYRKVQSLKQSKGGESALFEIASENPMKKCYMVTSGFTYRFSANDDVEAVDVFLDTVGIKKG